MLRVVKESLPRPDMTTDSHASAAHGDPLFSAGLEAINRFAGMVILFAGASTAFNVGILALSYAGGRPLQMWLALTQRRQAVSLDRIKLECGRLVAFSLLLLVAADVIETLVHPLHDVSLETLYKMAIVGVLRTGLAYFLGKEVEEITHHLAHAEHGAHAAHDDAGQAEHEEPDEPQPKKGASKKESKKNK